MSAAIRISMIFVIAAAACDAGDQELMERLTGELTEGPAPSISADTTSPAETTRADVEEGAARYVRSQTSVDSFDVQVEAVAEGWARVKLVPEDGATDPALLFLRRSEQGEWRGVAIGTAFAPFDLDELGVPAAVRP